MQFYFAAVTNENECDPNNNEYNPIEQNIIDVPSMYVIITRYHISLKLKFVSLLNFTIYIFSIY